ncbi:Ring finger, partial [Rhizoctonia solani]
MPSPSTPPLSSPPSPTAPHKLKNGTLLTPLRLTRSRRSHMAPPTPQSLVTSRISYELQGYSGEPTSQSPNQKLHLARDPNWRIREESVSPRDSCHDNLKEDEQAPVPTTPNKLTGPFTPQVTKKSRTPLRFDLPNISISDNPTIRGSFTDPPPRRREMRPLLNQKGDDSEVDQTESPSRVLTSQECTALFGSLLSPAFRSLVGTKCASCGGDERLSLLEPCRHQICASCVTGSLNVVGEKDMICMYCLSPIKSFQIARPFGRIQSEISPKVSPSMSSSRRILFSQDSSGSPGSYFTTPSRMDTRISSDLEVDLSIMVLRIDNIPWDVTPPMIEKWLGSPTLICHVLLDRVDGRTLNHAYVETTTEYARSALRTHQNKVLGYGRRARAVTITLSSQEELMHVLFPSWPGKFEGSLPVYETPTSDSRLSVTGNLLTESELGIILHLIQSPKSHFLKAPSLAYWSLISVLAKVPVPDVFAPGTLPEALFGVRDREDITTFALEQYELLVGTREYEPLVHTKLIDAALRCRAFTDRQLNRLFRFTNQLPSAMYVNQPSTSETPIYSRNQLCLVPPPTGVMIQPQGFNEGRGADFGRSVTLEACDRVAQDFGLDSMLVHALAERLVFHSSTSVSPSEHH